MNVRIIIFCTAQNLFHFDMWWFKKIGKTVFFHIEWNIADIYIIHRNATATLLLHFGTRAYLFSPDEGSCYVFRPETMVASFFFLMVLFFKVLLNHSSNTSFWCSIVVFFSSAWTKLKLFTNSMFLNAMSLRFFKVMNLSFKTVWPCNHSFL